MGEAKAKGTDGKEDYVEFVPFPDDHQSEIESLANSSTRLWDCFTKDPRGVNPKKLSKGDVLIWHPTESAETAANSEFPNLAKHLASVGHYRQTDSQPGQWIVLKADETDDNGNSTGFVDLVPLSSYHDDKSEVDQIRTC